MERPKQPIGRRESEEAFDRPSRELLGLVNDIGESETDIEAGRVKLLYEAFADIRRKLGWHKP